MTGDGVIFPEAPDHRTGLLLIEGMTLDTAGRSLRGPDGREIPLTPSEFDLLLVFVDRPGRALTRDSLLLAVSGRESESYDRAVDVLVGRLRRKIEPDPKAPRLIVTVPGVGYKFTARPESAVDPVAGAGRTAPQTDGPVVPRDHPSIAVLPFDNLSGDPEQDYFCDGMVEEIITALSRVKWFLVIARSSTFTYKGRAVDVKQVGRELGVRYVLEGSVRKSGNRVRITAQLIEAETGLQAWSDRFDGVIDDIFELQDRITGSIVGAIEPRMSAAELERIKRQRTGSQTAYDCFLRAHAHFYTETPEAALETQRLLNIAIASDPAFAPPYALAAENLLYAISQTWSADWERDLAEADRLARAGLEHGPDDPMVLAAGGHVIAYTACDFDASGALIERAMALNPNSAIVCTYSGFERIYAGDPERSLAFFTRALRLSPLDLRRHTCHSGMAISLVMLGRPEEAIEWGRKALGSGTTWVQGLRGLAAALANTGRIEEARDTWARHEAMAPGYRVGWVRARMRNCPELDLYIEGLLKSGMPE